MKIVTAAQMQRLDRLSTEKYGVPSLTLMENAGRAVVEFLEDRYSPLSAHKITILCGRGNNGGDGMVIARLLRALGLKPRVLLFADPTELEGDAAANCRRLNESGAPELVSDSAAWNRLKAELKDTTVVVDALLGTGLSRPLSGFLLQVVQDINAGFQSAEVVAVDLPSGLSSDSGEIIGESIQADASVTFTAPKFAHVFPPACERVGSLSIKEIGTPQEAMQADAELTLNLTTARDVSWVSRSRRRDSHKGTFGHVLLLAGSVGKTGAAALAARAALRSGAGLVTIATAKSALAVIAGLGMEFMTEPLPETDAGTISLRSLDYGRLDKLVAGKSVLALGPGIGSEAETAEWARTVVNRYDLPLVLDADGLNAFAGCMETFRGKDKIKSPAVLTPHPGEMARLTGLPTADIQKRRVEVAREFAAKHRVCVVLKGFRTVSAGPDGQVWINPTGNPGMATGGTGDVLTGIMAGLFAQNSERDPIDVAACAVYLHGLAGDLASDKFGETSMIAGDIVETLPAAFKALAAEACP